MAIRERKSNVDGAARENGRPTVRLKPASYQPSNAELDEPIILQNPDGSPPTPEDVARAIVRPVRVVRASE